MKDAYRSVQNNRRENLSFFQRFKWWIIAALSFIVILVIVLVVVFVAVLPNQNKSSGTGNVDSSGLVQKPDLSVFPKDLKVDDTAQANKYVPPLNEPFPYGTEMKIRGVNLGGWLVPEPFIVPSIFEDHIDEEVVDEWTLCEKIGKKKCSERLLKHYETWVTEEDIKTIRDAGLNHVRIPIGYWQLDIKDNEPFIYGGWDYLLKGIEWCRKYGLRVMIDFHGAPGSQNGWNHSGRLGDIRFLNKNLTESPQHVERFMKIVLDVVKYFDKDEYRNIVTQIGVLNEPAVYKTDQNLTLEFYKKSYEEIRKINGNRKNNPLLIYHEGFLGPSKWEGKLPADQFPRVVLDSHNYIIFDRGLIVKPLDEIGNFPCTAWVNDFQKSSKNFGWTMCGEFSVASNDCGKWLNGIGLGARYEGTYEVKTPACKDCTCKDVDDYTKFTSKHKTFLAQFAQKQMDAFENGIGWYFWNFKTENHINPHWDYFLGLKEGWMPKDANNRQYGCPPPEKKQN
ncbi:glycoside hydrolase [Neoconidiobolus thromboides FSU 785]|nr:glycoside hydrolase [Neoconidiobolus thromboides FSU 785]